MKKILSAIAVAASATLMALAAFDQDCVLYYDFETMAEDGYKVENIANPGVMQLKGLNKGFATVVEDTPSAKIRQTRPTVPAGDSSHALKNVNADTAWYYEQQKLWELRGRVHIRNVNGLIFDSEELFWDGTRHEFYSYKFSKVVTPERTLQGTYFRSDEHMLHYEVTNSVGSFMSEDIEGDNNGQQQSADAQKPDSILPARPAATRRKATSKPQITQP